MSLHMAMTTDSKAMPAPHFALIGGTSLLQSSLFTSLKPIIVETVEGKVRLFVGHDGNFVFVQRHEADPDNKYLPPHLINFPAIGAALSKLGVETVVSFASVGTLRPQTVPLHSVFVPDDHFCPWSSISFFAPKDKSRLKTDVHKAHIVPTLSTGARRRLVELIGRHPAFSSRLRDGGVYVTARGPRFETKSEVRFMATVGHVVGMTGSFEMTVLQEMDFDFAFICMVDNVANGLEQPKECPLSVESFKAGVHENLSTVETLASAVMREFGDGV